MQSSEELALKTNLSERDNGFGSRTTAPQEGFHASASAYQDINRTLGSFYEMPREDPEKEEMRTRLKELESRMSNEQQSPAITVNDQMALLEKSYQLARGSPFPLLFLRLRGVRRLPKGKWSLPVAMERR